MSPELRTQDRKHDISMLIGRSTYGPFGRALGKMGIEMERIEVNNNKELKSAADRINDCSRADDLHAIRYSFSDKDMMAIQRSLYSYANSKFDEVKLQSLMRMGFIPLIVRQTTLTLSELNAINIACQAKEPS